MLSIILALGLWSSAFASEDAPGPCVYALTNMRFFYSDIVWDAHSNPWWTGKPLFIKHHSHLKLLRKFSDYPDQIFSYEEIAAILGRGHSKSYVHQAIQSLLDSMRQIDPNFNAIRKWGRVGYYFESGHRPLYKLIEYGPLKLFAPLYEIQWKGSTLRLSTQEFHLLEFLAQKGDVATHEEINDAMLGKLNADAATPNHVLIGQLVSSINSLLKRVDPSYKGIQRVWRSGYFLDLSPDGSAHQQIIGNFKFSRINWEVYWKNQKLEVPRAAFYTLLILVESPGTEFSAVEIYDPLPAAQRELDPESKKRVVSNLISQLRSEFNRIEPGSRMIRTVLGEGYSWIGTP